jgi:hypothetical protein
MNRNQYITIVPFNNVTTSVCRVGGSTAFYQAHIIQKASAGSFLIFDSDAEKQ